MRSKIILSTLLIGLALFSFKSPESNKHDMKLNEEQTADGVQLYQQNHEQFTYFIGSIGFVSIDKVELNNGKLTAIYSYKQGNEIRNVVSVLDLDSDGVYKGTCTTKVKGETLFAVNTWLTFNNDGTAKGNWSWSGSPTTEDAIVTITKS